MPLLKARRALEGLEPGQSLLVVTSDPASVRDISAFGSRTGVGVQVIRDREPFELLITK